MYVDCLKIAGVTIGITWLLMALPLYLFAEAPMVWGAISGFLLSAFCFIAGFYAICRSFDASLNSLMIALFGGMLARMVLIGAIFLFVVWWTSLHVASFLASLLGFYLLFLVLELYFVKQRLVKGE
jgi:hypothetical protein